MAATRKSKELWHTVVDEKTNETLSHIVLRYVKTSDCAKEVAEKIRREYDIDVPYRRVIERARMWGYGFGKSNYQKNLRKEKIDLEKDEEKVDDPLDPFSQTDCPKAPEPHTQDIIEEIQTLSRVAAYFRGVQYETQHMIFLRAARRIQGLLPRQDQDKVEFYLSRIDP